MDLALAAEDAVAERVDAIVAERDRVVTGLRGQGWDLPDADGNFVWFGLGEDTARFAAAAEEQGVVVRPYGTDGVRATIGEPGGNDVLLRVAAAFSPKV